MIIAGASQWCHADFELQQRAAFCSRWVSETYTDVNLVNLEDFGGVLRLMCAVWDLTPNAKMEMGVHCVSSCMVQIMFHASNLLHPLDVQLKDAFELPCLF